MSVNQQLRELAQQADPWAVDLLLSALAGAAASARRATCTTPFPSASFAAGGERDYVALLESVQALPPTAHLAASVDSLSQQQAELLHWLLTHPQRPVRRPRCKPSHVGLSCSADLHAASRLQASSAAIW